MSQEKLPIREISKARICWHILKRRQDKPVNECAEAILKSLEEEFNYRLIPEPSQDKVQKIKDICRSMITASHYNNLEDDMFESYIKEICQLFTIPELTLLTDEEMEVLLFQYIMPQDSFQKSIYIDLMKIGIQAQLSKNKKELGL